MQLRGDVHGQAVGVASAQVIDADPKRYTLLLSAPANVEVTITRRNPAVLGAGINLHQSNRAVELCRDKYGSLLDGPFFGIASVATTIGVGEGTVHD